MGADSTLRNTAHGALAPSPRSDKTGKGGHQDPAVVFLGQRTPIRCPPKPGAQGARVIGEAGRGLPRDAPQGFGARHPPRARLLYTGGRSGDCLLTCGRQALGAAARRRGARTRK